MKKRIMQKQDEQYKNCSESVDIKIPDDLCVTDFNRPSVIPYMLCGIFLN